MVLPVKCLPCRHEDLSSTPMAYLKIWAQWHMLTIAMPGGKGGPVELTGQAAYPQLRSYGPIRDFVSKIKVE